MAGRGHFRVSSDDGVGSLISRAGRTQPVHAPGKGRALKEAKSEQTQVINLGPLQEIVIALPQTLLILRESLLSLSKIRLWGLDGKVLDSVFISPLGQVEVRKPGHPLRKLNTPDQTGLAREPPGSSDEVEFVAKIIEEFESVFAPVLDDFCLYLVRYSTNKLVELNVKKLLSLICIYSKCFRLKIPARLSETSLIELKLLKFKQEEVYIKQSSPNKSDLLRAKKSQYFFHRGQAKALTQLTQPPHHWNLGGSYQLGVQSFIKLHKHPTLIKAWLGPEDSKNSQLSTIGYDSSLRMSNAKHYQPFVNTDARQMNRVGNLGLHEIILEEEKKKPIEGLCHLPSESPKKLILNLESDLLKVQEIGSFRNLLSSFIEDGSNIPVPPEKHQKRREGRISVEEQECPQRKLKDL